jgi:hypothetical protein
MPYILPASPLNLIVPALRSTPTPEALAGSPSTVHPLALVILSFFAKDLTRLPANLYRADVPAEQSTSSQD